MRLRTVLAAAAVVCFAVGIKVMPGAGPAADASRDPAADTVTAGASADTRTGAATNVVDDRAADGTTAVAPDRSARRVSDWPRYRGPRGDGISPETGLATEWPADGPPELWRVPLGEGFSGISWVDGRLYTMYGRDRIEWVGAFDAATGEEVWRFRSDSLYVDAQGNGPRSTPTVHDGVVYALGAKGKLHALAADDGHLVWGHDLVEEFGARPPQWGVATVPLVEDELLLVNAGGRPDASIIAFDRRTGREVWRALDDPAGYAAPIAVTLDGVRQAIFFTAAGLASLDPEDGDLHWRVPWTTSFDVNAASPVFIAPDRIFVSSGYDVGAGVYRVDMSDGTGDVEEVWRNRILTNQFSSSVLWNGHLYGFDNSILVCADAATGERRWRARGFGHGSVFWADGHLVVLGERGRLALVRATPEGFVEVAATRILEERTWTVPTLVDGVLYVRTEREMLALQLSEDLSGSPGPGADAPGRADTADGARPGRPPTPQRRRPK